MIIMLVQHEIYKIPFISNGTTAGLEEQLRSATYHHFSIGGNHVRIEKSERIEFEEV